MKYTQGPWRALLMGDEQLGFVLSLHSEKGDNFANVKLFGDIGTVEANACLIAVAPELLEACKTARRELAADIKYAGICLDLHKAIAKAEGVNV